MAMAQINKHTGGFSEKERDRRFQHAREFMQEKGLDALLVLGPGFALALVVYGINVLGDALRDLTMELDARDCQFEVSGSM